MAPTAPAPVVTDQTSASKESINPNAAVPSDNIYKITKDSAKGQFLTDFQGMTLYVFDNDKDAGKITCYDACAAKWPAYTSGAAAQGTFPDGITLMDRKDGTKQFAYKGRPLYYYYQDKAAGDTLGDGIGGIWHLVTP